MPTGYTESVKSGQVTEFSDFALRCARAFGALIEMRDEPLTAKIPERVEPDTTYYDDSIETARRRLRELESMLPEEANKESRAEREQNLREIEERKERRKADRMRYEAMLSKVRQWEPPSAEHVGLKEFMEKQLVDSIDFDCDDTYDKPDPFMNGEEWRAEQIRKARKDIDYLTRERQKEVERTESRNAWIRQLLDSLRGHE